LIDCFDRWGLLMWLLFLTFQPKRSFFWKFPPFKQKSRSLWTKPQLKLRVNVGEQFLQISSLNIVIDTSK
jgi:hypothetical protein